MPFILTDGSTGATSLGQLSDVILTNLQPNQVIAYNGTKWVNVPSASATVTWGSITGTLANQTDLQAALDLKQNYPVSVTKVADYTLVQSDDTKFIVCEPSVGSLTITVPSLAIGSKVTLLLRGTGSMTIVADTGVTLLADHPTITEEGGIVELYWITITKVTAIGSSSYVDLDETQTIGGIKTFTSHVLDTATTPITSDSNLITRGFANTNYVDKTTAQTVAGVKTFSSYPILPATAPTTANQATSKSYVDSKVFYADVVRSTPGAVSLGAADAFTTQRFNGGNYTITLNAGLAGSEIDIINISPTGKLTIVAGAGVSFGYFGSDVVSPLVLQEGRYQSVRLIWVATNTVNAFSHMLTVDVFGNQDIDGVKNFTSFPTLPVGSSPSSDAQAINKKYLDNRLLSSYVNVTAGITTLSQQDHMRILGMNTAVQQIYVPKLLVGTRVMITNLQGTTTLVGTTVTLQSLGGSLTLNSNYQTVELEWITDTTVVVHGQIGGAEDSLLVHKAGAETITGVKTFSVLPESSVAPTTANQLTNKSYVDSHNKATFLNAATNLTLSDAHFGVTILCDAAITITVPDSLTNGFWCNFVNSGGLTVTFAASGTMVLRYAIGNKLKTQYAGATLEKKDSTNAYLIGFLEA